MKNQDDQDEMRNDPDNYKWGIFYFNPKDARCFVPKRIAGLGWTLNFANPCAWLVIAVIITLAFLVGNIGHIVK